MEPRTDAPVFTRGNKPASRRYPTCCTAEFCGSCEPTCRACPFGIAKDDFERWRRETAALEPDPIWSPGCFVATREAVPGDPGWFRDIEVTTEDGPGHVSPGWALAKSWRNSEGGMHSLRRACLDGHPSTLETPHGMVTFRRVEMSP